MSQPHVAHGEYWETCTVGMKVILLETGAEVTRLLKMFLECRRQKPGIVVESCANETVLSLAPK